jgi:cell fate regulator YaaT (PSP1 superfamily)
MFASRRLASELGLQMKISDVEYQGDGSKATFYYTAEERVDFRQLIRNLADEFRLKIEMKQIGVRQEAARLGGIGSCGRELCCSTWLTDFRSVSTASARYQQLSLNPQKLAGQCGKLKCCLNYELDAYLEALKKFPRSDVRLITQKGVAFHVKTEVFKEQMWYIQEDKKNPGAGGFIPLTPDRVHEIIKLNKAGEIPVDLKDFMIEVEVEIPDYTDVVGQDDLNRFEHVFKRNKKKKKKKKPSGGQQTQNSNKPAKQGNKQNPNQNKRKPNPNQKRKPNPNQQKTANNKNPNQKANPPRKKRPNNNPNQKKTNPQGAKTGNENKNPRSEKGETKKPNNNRNRNRNKKRPNTDKPAGEKNEKKDA